MSRRAIKKLYGNDDLKLKDEVEKEESSDEEQAQPTKPNLFAMLGGDDDDEEQEEESEKEEPEPVKPIVAAPAKSKSKSKKKKKKGKQAAADKPQEPKEEDIDELIASMGLETKRATPDWFELLKVDTRYLDYELEFKKLFGKEAMSESVNGGESFFPAPTTKPKDWGGRDGRSVPGTTRKLVFSKVRPHFLPTLKREIMMEQVHEPEDDVYQTTSFKFVHTEPYATAQRLFQYLLAISEPQTIINQVLPKSLYHTPTLLMIAENMAQGGGQHSEAADMIERCLLVFDRAFKPAFTFDGSCRLPFKYAENRAFYMVLMKHLKVLMRRGTWTTAFEFAKFLWSLSPEVDPYGVGHMIDFFAINAGREEYILQLAENTHFAECHAHRPNIIYSRALAYSMLHPTETKQVESYLKDAVKKFPWVASMLLDNTFVTEHEALAEQQLLGGLYVIQMKNFWSRYGMIKMLSRVVDSVKLDPVSQSGTVSPDTVRYALVSEQKEVFGAIPKEYLEGVMWADDPVPPEDDVNPYPPRTDIREYI